MQLSKAGGRGGLRVLSQGLAPILSAAWSEASIPVTGSQSDRRRLGHTLLLRSRS